MENKTVHFLIYSKDLSPVNTVTVNNISHLFFQLILLIVREESAKEVDINDLASNVTDKLSNYSSKHTSGVYNQQACRNLATTAVRIQSSGRNNLKGRKSDDGEYIVLDLPAPPSEAST